MAYVAVDADEVFRTDLPETIIVGLIVFHSAWKKVPKACSLNVLDALRIDRSQCY